MKQPIPQLASSRTVPRSIAVVRQIIEAINRLHDDEWWDLCQEIGFVGRYDLENAELRIKRARRLVSKLWKARRNLTAELTAAKEALRRLRDSRRLPVKVGDPPKKKVAPSARRKRGAAKKTEAILKKIREFRSRNPPMSWPQINRHFGKDRESKYAQNMLKYNGEWPCPPKPDGGGK